MTEERIHLTSRILLRAVLPVAKVVLEDDESMKKKFADVEAVFQIKARSKDEEIGAYFTFNRGDVAINQGIHENPDIQFAFKSLKAMNSFLTGGVALPSIKGFTRPALLIKCVMLLLSLMILMPSKKPKKYERIRLKVKMVMYMITTALSQYNKGGDPDMQKWTAKQPDRIYQMSCEPEGIAAYVRVKAGKSRAGRGYYTRKRPFVHMKFNGARGALPVFLNDVEFVDAIGKGYVEIEGSPEYAAGMNDFMQRIQTLVT